MQKVNTLLVYPITVVTQQTGTPYHWHVVVCLYKIKRYTCVWFFWISRCIVRDFSRGTDRYWQPVSAMLFWWCLSNELFIIQSLMWNDKTLLSKRVFVSANKSRFAPILAQTRNRLSDVRCHNSIQTVRQIISGHLYVKGMPDRQRTLSQNNTWPSIPRCA